MVGDSVRAGDQPPLWVVAVGLDGMPTQLVTMGPVDCSSCGEHASNVKLSCLLGTYTSVPQLQCHTCHVPLVECRPTCPHFAVPPAPSRVRGWLLQLLARVLGAVADSAARQHQRALDAATRALNGDRS